MSTSTVKYKRDFPSDVGHFHFTKTPIGNINDAGNKQNIIIGDCYFGSAPFFAITVDNRTKTISYNQFRRQSSNLEHAGLIDATYTHSYLVRQNKYLVIFKGNYCYNVYNLEKEKWLLKRNEKKLKCNYFYTESQSLLINDEIIIVSCLNQLLFYSIANNHITDPQLLCQYNLKNNKLCFKNHGMCCIDFKTIETKDSKTYNTKIMLFGGNKNKNFLSSFLSCDISISYNYKTKQSQLQKQISIKEHLVDHANNKLKSKLKSKSKHNINYNDVLNGTLYNFGYQCIFNSLNEAIIIMIGGYDSECQNQVLMYNCVTQDIVIKEKVEYIL